MCLTGKFDKMALTEVVCLLACKILSVLQKFESKCSFYSR